MCVLRDTVKRVERRKILAYNDRYRQYVIEKANLPYGMTPMEYEKAVRKIAKKYKI